jgi:uncharacterized protein YndB with AHSA1/START domain
MAEREIEIEASPDEVWDALATEEGRERWLEEPDRAIVVESEEAPRRLVWWWSDGDAPATRVEFVVAPSPAGTRVRVIETVPSFPLATLAASFALVAA